MKVKDLQKLLSKLEQDMDVVCYIEDEVTNADGSPMNILEIDSVEEKEMSARENGAQIKFEMNEYSKKVALISLISDI